MPDRILTSHAGSLPRPEDLIALNHRRAARDRRGGVRAGASRTPWRTWSARQREIGIDLVNDGEFGHSMGQRYDYGSWWTYVFQRLGGLELSRLSICGDPQPMAKPGRDRAGVRFVERRDWQAVQRGLRRPDVGRVAAGHRREPERPGLPRADHLPGPGRAAAGHRRPQGRDGGRRGRRRLPELGGAGQLRPVRQRVLRHRRGDAVRVRRRDARGVHARSSTPG